MHPRTTKNRHYHVTVGPPEVNVYDASNTTRMAGPYYDVIVSNAEDAVRLWATLANTILQTDILTLEQVSQEEVDAITEDILGSEWQFEYEESSINVGYEIGHDDQFIAITDCGGCVPRTTN